MSDIVERLRKGVTFNDLDPANPLMRQAADEIERLRAALKEIADLRYSNTSAATIAQNILQGSGGMR